MYAVIETGGKQYRVEVGTELAVELLDVEPGQEITLDRVLLVADADESAIGRPLVDGAAVKATVLRADRGEKVISFKYKQKTRRRVKKGHRQDYTVLRITDVQLGTRSAAAERAAEQERVALAREQAAEEAAALAAADAALAATLAEKAKAAEAAEAAEASEASGGASTPAEAAKRPRRRPKAAASQPEAAEAVEEDEAAEVGAEDAAPADAVVGVEPAESAAEPASTPAADAPAEPATELAAEAPAVAEEKPRRSREAKKED